MLILILALLVTVPVLASDTSASATPPSPQSPVAAAAGSTPPDTIVGLDSLEASPKHANVTDALGKQLKQKIAALAKTRKELESLKKEFTHVAIDLDAARKVEIDLRAAAKKSAEEMVDKEAHMRHELTLMQEQLDVLKLAAHQTLSAPVEQQPAAEPEGSNKGTPLQSFFAVSPLTQTLKDQIADLTRENGSIRTKSAEQYMEITKLQAQIRSMEEQTKFNHGLDRERLSESRQFLKDRQSQKPEVTPSVGLVEAISEANKRIAELEAQIANRMEPLELGELRIRVTATEQERNNARDRAAAVEANLKKAQDEEVKSAAQCTALNTGIETEKKNAAYYNLGLGTFLTAGFAGLGYVAYGNYKVTRLSDAIKKNKLINVVKEHQGNSQDLIERVVNTFCQVQKTLSSEKLKELSQTVGDTITLVEEYVTYEPEDKAACEDILLGLFTVRSGVQTLLKTA